MADFRRSLKLFRGGILVCFLTFLIIGSAEMSPGQAPPQHPLFAQAESLWQQSRWDDAALAYEAYLRQNPEGPQAAEAYMNLGQYIEAHNRFEDALTLYQEGLRRATGSMCDILNTEIAAVQTKMGNLDQAIEIYQGLMRQTTEWNIFKSANRELKSVLRLKAWRKQVSNNAPECGRDSLIAVFHQYGITPSESIFSRTLRDGPRGISLASLSRAATDHGLKAYGVRVKDNNIDAITPPAILHFNPGHYVVLKEKTKGQLKLFDPSSPAEKESVISMDRLRQVWTGNALVFNRPKFSKRRITPLSEKEMGTLYGSDHWWHTGFWSKLGDFLDNVKQIFDDPPGIFVNTSTLNLVIVDVDAVWKTIGGSIQLKRTYNSDDSTAGMFGNSWNFEYEVSIKENPDGTVSLFRGSGRWDIFTSQGGGAYSPPGGVYDTLTKSSDGTYRLLLKDSKKTYLFNSNGYLTSILDRNGNEVDVTWNQANHITKLIVHYGTTLSSVISFEYNSSGQCNRLILPDGRYASFDYDKGNLVKVTDMGGYQTVYQYNEHNFITSIATSIGTSQLIYQDLGSGIYAAQKVIDPLGKERTYATADYWVVVTDARGNSTSYLAESNFNFTGNIIDANGAETSYGYDTYGNRTLITDPNGNSWRFSYEPQPNRGDLTKITDPLGNVTQLAYDSNDNVISMVDAGGNTTTLTYDQRNNLKQTTDAGKRVTAFACDSFGELTGLTDANGNMTTFSYDSFGNLLSERSPANNAHLYEYDSAGRVKAHTDPNANRITYAYDARDRLTHFYYPDGTSKSLSYDCCRLSCVTDSTGTILFTYANDNSLTGVTDVFGKTISYGYDKGGNLTALAYPDGKVVHYEYDNTDRLIKVSDWLGNSVTYEYDFAGNLIQTTLPGGSIVRQEYDAADRLKSIADFNADGTTNAIFRYTLDSLGNKTAMSFYQPTAASVSPGVSGSYTYDAENRMLTAGSGTFTYDKNGNLQSKFLEGGLTFFSWNYNNMLTKVTSSGASALYTYDALGNRVARTENSVETRYVVDPSGTLSRVLAETDSTGNVTSYYVYGLGLLSKIIPAGQAYFYHYDGLGSAIAVADASGNLVNRYSYDAFGKLIGRTEAMLNPFQYVGRYGIVSEGSGLLFMRARYYDPEIGRFLSMDPMGIFGGINQYSYSRANPIAFFDPTGLTSWFTGTIKQIGDFLYTFFTTAVSAVISEPVGTVVGVALDPNLPEAAGAIPHIVWESRINKALLEGTISVEEYVELHNLQSSNQWQQLKLRWKQCTMK